MAEENPMIDYLFRHQHGRMVAILCRIFGLEHLETIEDAVQDTFIKAIGAWRNELPDNPEAWLTTAAKNRLIDLFRSIKSARERHENLTVTAAIAVDQLFLDDEIADSQLRMIFTACHPALDPRDQIAFALKAIGGFSRKEIAAALLLKEETIKKRITRARKAVADKIIRFEIPQGEQLRIRTIRVLEVIYLLFNEGFHSAQKDLAVRKELCGEALRLSKMLIDNPLTCNADVQALFALMCFHSARLDSKINESNEILDLRTQDRSKWYFPLVVAGNDMMNLATASGEYSVYHYEAAIACEHLRAQTFEETNWKDILKWYQKLEALNPSPFNLLNMAVVNLQQADFSAAQDVLQQLEEDQLGQRKYLYHGCWAEYYKRTGDAAQAIHQYDVAISMVPNDLEKEYLLKKRERVKAD
ncbi:RNA polymerase sigma factor [Neolewinella persica]|uniref:RNA polymerase sigma factor n=1 Tax=Neolewinella persica TaxID=70998 RepID=UPI0003694B59|nr:sigma-70 family RNA polymerase sigma factor [Neolewinella persica]